MRKKYLIKKYTFHVFLGASRVQRHTHISLRQTVTVNRRIFLILFTSKKLTETLQRTCNTTSQGD